MTSPRLPRRWATVLTLGATFMISVPVRADQTLLSRGPSSVSLSARSFDLYDALRLYAQHARISIYLDDSVPHKLVSYRLIAVDDRAAIQALLQANGLGSTLQGGILFIARPDVLATKYGAQNQLVETVPVAGGSPISIAANLQTFLPPGTIVWPDETRGVVIVRGSEEAIAQARTLLGAVLGERVNSYDLQTVLVPMRYATSAQGILQQLQAALNPSGVNTATLQPSLNAIALHGTRSFIGQAIKLIALIDAPQKQILYTISIVEVKPEALTQATGILFGGVDAHGNPVIGAASTVTTFSGTYVAVNAQLDLLVQRGEARILERPTILTTNGVTGSTTFGTDIPIVVQDPITGIGTVRTITAGVQLSATPTIGENTILTKLSTTYSDVIGTGQGGYPILARRTVDNTFVTHPDDVLLVAGLYEINDSQTIQSVPYLSEIPLIGGLFKHKDRQMTHTEVVAIIQPHLQDADSSHQLPVTFPAVQQEYLRDGLLPAQASHAPMPASAPK